MKNADHLWSVILARGERETAWPTRGRLCQKPRRYSPGVDRKSPFQDTVVRMDRLGASGRRVALITESERQEVLAQLTGMPLGKLISQPRHRGTAAEVFFPLTYIRAWDPRARVIITRADHVARPTDAFVDEMAYALSATEPLKDQLLLFGVEPDKLEFGQGWIQPNGDFGTELKRVGAFVERPSPSEALELMASGAFWNTLIVAGTVQRFWELGWYCLPEMMPFFAWLTSVLETPAEERVLEIIHDLVPIYDFSSDLLYQVSDCLLAFELRRVSWSDGKYDSHRVDSDQVRYKAEIQEPGGGERQPKRCASLVRSRVS